MNKASSSPTVSWITHLPATLQTAGDDAFWADIQASHARPPRHYHTWQHIASCLDAARAYTFDDETSVVVALLFHDIVYVAGRKDNEALSAQTMLDMMAGRVSKSVLVHANRMILATANHAALPANAPRDDKLMVDIDLGILATPAPIYTRYAAQVRAEWVPAVVNDAQFNVGRAQFLRQTLAAPHIFHSKEFVVHEKAARSNMECELSELGA
jgi:predicted metal-dependent HD superfamily phosphohydrolase